MRKQNLIATILFVVLHAVVAAQTLPFTFNPDTLSAKLEKMRRDWNAPGLAVALVRNDSVVYAQGFGVTNIDQPQPVDANTLFAVASNTKSFTAAAIAMMVDSGRMEWDAPVKRYLPWFESYDPWVTANTTLRDLLSHRTGHVTFSGDLIWSNTLYSRREVVERARLLTPHHGFRAGYGYSNINFIAAGLALEAVTNQPWEDVITSRILKPAGMTRTLTSITQIPTTTNVAMPHTAPDGKMMVIEWQNWDNMAPAGALISSVNDMAQWIRVQLRRGELPGSSADAPKKLWSEKVQNEMWQPNVMNPISTGAQKNNPTTHFRGYGLGWSLYDYQGEKLVNHGGGYDGMLSTTTFIPGKNCGFVVLTNCNEPLYYVVSQTLQDLICNTPEPRDWNSFLLERVKKNKEQEQKDKAEALKNRRHDTQPTLPLADYSGTYNDPIYGAVEVTMTKKGALRLNMKPTPGFTSQMNHWEYNTFTIRMEGYPSLPEGKAWFTVGPDGKATALHIDVPNPDFDFTEFTFERAEK
ncbi:MAG: serine hydrolase [Bacteroidales bacterium]|nr:serine hydrolase [Bacteroidales bacterium]MDD3665863.1 serine hydrolase [Bacteroidales bacterium]